ncbi:MAG TPA: PPK2 family polyphosphate kinase [Cytophagaceae bacterium]|jgi:PPK2 family polyphosphate:nucleotide phosphotransferase
MDHSNAEIISLANFATIPDEKIKKEDCKVEMKGLHKELLELQKVLYAQGKYSVLVVFQGLDASGKDGAVNEVFSGINPLGCSVKAFKAPSKEELSYDFLWRIHKYVPAKGMIQVFNRSHYEDVLVPKVEQWIDNAVVENRYLHINNFEKLLGDHHTLVLKFYLHISRDEQKQRLQERLTDPKKFWKHNDNDMATSEKWDKYMEAYNMIFTKCNHITPWHIIPSDKNWYKEYLIARILVDELKKLDLRYPERA